MLVVVEKLMTKLRKLNKMAYFISLHEVQVNKKGLSLSRVLLSHLFMIRTIFVVFQSFNIVLVSKAGEKRRRNILLY